MKSVKLCVSKSSSESRFEMINHTMYRIREIIAVVGALLILLAMPQSAVAQKVRLRSQITPSCSSGTSNWKFADIYGDGNIAVQGTYNCRGAFIYDISDPEHPVIANWYNPGSNQQFLEAIVVGSVAYFGSGNGGGVHIVSVADPYNPVLLGTVTSSNGGGFDNIHEIVVIRQGQEDFLIENYNGTGTKTLKVVNVTNPASPVFVRDIVPTDPQWVHAMHVRGNRLITSGWGNSVSRARTEIYDITNIKNQAPVLLGFIQDGSSTVTNGNNMHSSWTSDDGRYLYSAREVTNSNGSSPGDIRIYDIANPAQPLLVNRISMSDLGLNAVTPHNPVVLGSKLYVSWYQAGLQVFDLTVPTAPKRVGQYDPFPATFAPDANSLSLADEPWDLVCGTDAIQNYFPTSYDGTWAVYPFLGESKVLVGDMTYGLLVVDVSKATEPSMNRLADFDGDRRTDASVFRPTNGVWYIESSTSGSMYGFQFGLADDRPVQGDFDGDGKVDVAVFRPSNGVWYILGSSNGFFAVQFGMNGDLPVAGDYDADGRTDIAVFRPASGVWYVMQSTLGFRAAQWGMNGDKPLVGDFEGDGKSDFAVYRPDTGVWYVLQSSSSVMIAVQFGASTDKPVTGDFDGDGKTDFSVYRPSTGAWWQLKSGDSSIGVVSFGLSEDVPVPGDYDGDGKADIAVFRPSGGVWYRLNSSDSSFVARQFGVTGDVPSPSVVQP